MYLKQVKSVRLKFFGQMGRRISGESSIRQTRFLYPLAEILNYSFVDIRRIPIKHSKAVLQNPFDDIKYSNVPNKCLYMIIASKNCYF